MDESLASKEQRLKQLELDNQRRSQRVIAVSKLYDNWQKANQTSISKVLPILTLKEFKDSINYRPDDTQVFLAGVDRTSLKDYQDRIKQREQARAVYNSNQPKSGWLRISEFTRIVAIGVSIALFVSLIFLILY